jgi:hypothetical protein
MSINNQLLIIKSKKGFEVHENMCVDNYFKPNKNTLLKVEDTLIKAIKYAKQCCNEYPYVEYGFTISDNCLVEKKK